MCFQIKEDPSTKKSEDDAGKAQLVVLQASGEATCVDVDLKPGMSVTGHQWIRAPSRSLWSLALGVRF